MAKKSYSLPPSITPQILMGLCQICGNNQAGPGGMCAACAGAVIGPSNGIWTVASPVPPSITAATIMAAAQHLRAMADNEKPEPLPRADMQVVDLVGWRVWRITSLGYLRSLTADAIWLPGVPMEAPSVVDRQGQGSGADYGVHVFKVRNGAILEAENYTSRSEQHVGYAIGSVLLWGDVVEHERGYRAERAKILSIDDVTWRGKPPWDKETAEVLGFLRQRYGVGGVPRGTSAGDAP